MDSPAPTRPAQGGTLSLSRIPGLEGDVPQERFQDPTLRQTKRGVWFFRAMVNRIRDGKVTRVRETFHIGTVGKREADAKKREIMRTLNRAEYVITSQIPLNTFLEEYQTLHVARLSASTRAKYENHLKNHIKPVFGHLMLCEITPLLVQQCLDAKHLSWATKTDLRNILSSIFTKAFKWKRWQDANPIESVSAGRERAAREQRKLSSEETRRRWQLFHGTCGYCAVCACSARYESVRLSAFRRSTSISCGG
jgi:hypothetical protein